MSAQSSTVLDRIVAETREEVERRKRGVPLPLGPDGWRALSAKGRFRDSLDGPGIGVIAEFKRRSPSAGTLRDDVDLRQIVGAYERGGAVALSVLTEGPNFGGSLEDLAAARRACPLPILRKDFIVDPYQLHEAHAAGADAVLLIVAALEPGELESLYEGARAIELDVVVEVHDDEELDRALSQGAEIVGINNRDLKDFSVDIDRTARLIERIPHGVRVISESGIATAEQVDRLKASGVHAVLVGESLMRSPDPQVALRALQEFNDADNAL